MSQEKKGRKEREREEDGRKEGKKEEGRKNYGGVGVGEKRGEPLAVAESYGFLSSLACLSFPSQLLPSGVEHL